MLHVFARGIVDNVFAKHGNGKAIHFTLAQHSVWLGEEVGDGVGSDEKGHTAVHQIDRENVSFFLVPRLDKFDRAVVFHVELAQKQLPQIVVHGRTLGLANNIKHGGGVHEDFSMNEQSA